MSKARVWDIVASLYKFAVVYAVSQVLLQSAHMFPFARTSLANENTSKEEIRLLDEDDVRHALSVLASCFPRRTHSAARELCIRVYQKKYQSNRMN